MYFIMILIIGLLLFAAGVMDLKSKTISRKYILGIMAVCLTGAFVNIFLYKEIELWEAMGGSLIGVCMIGLSVAGKEQIGRGDGIVITAIGIVLGFRKCLFAVCMASIIMTLVSVILLILHKGNGKTKIPFLPALFAGYVICMTM